MAVILIFLVCAPFLILWRAFVLVLLWSWFIVPTFCVGELSMPVAFGISLLVGMMTEHYHYSKDERTAASQIASQIVSAALSPAVILLMAWIATLFMG